MALSDRRHIAIAVALGVRADMGRRARNDAFDP